MAWQLTLTSFCSKSQVRQTAAKLLRGIARSLAKTRSCAPKCTCSFGQSRPPCLIYLLDRRTNGELLLKCLSSEQVAFHQKRRQKRPCSPVRTRLGQAEAKPDVSWSVVPRKIRARDFRLCRPVCVCECVVEEEEDVDRG